MKPVYLLSLFYSKAALSKDYFQSAKAVVSVLSNDDFQLLGVGENHTAIAFTSDRTGQEIRRALGDIMTEHTHVLLTEVSDVMSTNIARKTVEWFAHRLAGWAPK